MLHYVYGQDLHHVPELACTMFTDRATQFRDRLAWDVQVDPNGYERDQYDDLNPLYAIWQRPDGTHGGSMRFLPTVGRTMVAEHFQHLTDGVTIASPLIWECTRFCLAPGAGSRESTALVLAAGELMTQFHLRHFVGVFDARMPRIYRRYGLNPDVIGQAGTGKDLIAVGLWEMNDEVWEPTLRRVGIDRATSKNWLLRSLALRPQKEPIFA